MIISSDEVHVSKYLSKYWSIYIHNSRTQNFAFSAVQGLPHSQISEDEIHHFCSPLIIQQHRAVSLSISESHGLLFSQKYFFLDITIKFHSYHLSLSEDNFSALHCHVTPVGHVPTSVHKVPLTSKSGTYSQLINHFTCHTAEYSLTLGVHFDACHGSLFHSECSPGAVYTLF